MDIYCIKCKKKTPTLNLIESVTKNNRPILKGTCEICQIKKNRFISKSKSGGDIVSSVISKIPVELHLRTLKGKKYSFCGPNTNLIERLNPDDTPKEWLKSINKVDKVCLRHDLNNLTDLNINEKLAKAVIMPIIATTHKLGLGVIKKQI